MPKTPQIKLSAATKSDAPKIRSDKIACASKKIKKAITTRASTTGSAEKDVSESKEIAILRANLEFAEGENARFTAELDEAKAKFKVAEEENARYAKELDEAKAKFESAEEAIEFAWSFVQRTSTDHEVFSLLHMTKEQIQTPEGFQAALLEAKPSSEAPAECEELSSVLDALAGCTPLKEIIRTAYHGHIANQRRSEMGIPVPKTQFPVYVFLGNSGTGKTTAARHLGKGLKLAGLISTSTIVELTRAHLVGAAVGTTGPKVKTELRKHGRKLVLIDEAYIFDNGGPEDYGREAIAELIVWMESTHNQSVFVFAGYKDQMLAFIDMNPGFQGRVTEVIEFDDITPDKMAEMFILHVKGQNVFTLHEDINEGFLKALFASLPENLRTKHNGRLAKALYEFGIQMLNERFTKNNYAGWSTETANLIMPVDLAAALKMVQNKEVMS